MKKLILSVALAGMFWQGATAGRPDEGMWLPIQIKKISGKMQKAGLKLSPEDIFDINKPGVKDAIVSLGGFCTAEIISNQGLLLTNHHCAYDAIQSHSTVQNDYLTNGFWAKNLSQELHVTGLTASILVRMEDVTERVKAAIKDLPREKRGGALQKIYREITEEATKGTHYTANVKPVFDGNQYILSVSETFKDVRLVGAPPSSIGKFGGDTDNWMWPRHTGDFSLLRIYSGKDGKPADFSTENVPLKPRHSLAINITGVKEGDYTMIMGYPGRTNRYLTAAEVEANLENQNLPIQDLYGTKMGIYKADMDKNDTVRIKLASDYASGMNTYKYMIGQALGLKKGGLVAKKLAYEQELQNWIDADANRKAKYGNVLANLRKAIKEAGPVLRQSLYYNIGLLDNGLIAGSQQMGAIKAILDEKTVDQEKLKTEVERLKGELDKWFKDYVTATDEKVFAAQLFNFYSEVDKSFHPAMLEEILKTYKAPNAEAAFAAYAKDVYSKSVLVSRARLEAFLANPTKKALDKDLGLKYANTILPDFMSRVAPMSGKVRGPIAAERELLLEAMMAFQPERDFAPDANSTLRLTFGNVKPYFPKDGVFYNYFTTDKGILEKEDPKNEEFIVPARAKELLEKKDFGRYGNNGVLNVGFLSNNDITGGNSGSPVMNDRGQLIGVAFDGNWESMTGDLMFSNEVQRTISVDARYVLWTIEKFAGANNLIAEMNIVKDEPVLEAPVAPVVPQTPAPADLEKMPKRPAKAPAKKNMTRK